MAFSVAQTHSRLALYKAQSPKWESTGICIDDPKYEKKGREKHIEKQEQWNQFLPTPKS